MRKIRLRSAYPGESFVVKDVPTARLPDAAIADNDKLSGDIGCRHGKAGAGELG